MAAIEPYQCSLGKVIAHDGGAYHIRTPQGRIIGVMANGTLSAANVEADIASPYQPPLPAMPPSVRDRIPVGRGFAGLPRPLIIAHRGGSVVAPEHTLEAYRISASHPGIVLEMDVHVIGDGAQACIHDATVDRTTLGAGPLSAYGVLSLRALRMRQAVSGGLYGDLSASPALFEDALREFGNRAPIVVEVKTAGAGQLMADTLLAHGIFPEHVIVTAANDAALQPARAAGYSTMYAVSASGTPASVASLGHAWVSLSDSVSNDRLASFRAAGIKVALYSIETHHEADQAIARGADAIFSDDPLWVARRTVRRTSDPYFAMRNQPGSQGRRADTPTCISYEPGKLVLDHAEHLVGQLQGWAWPMTASVELTLSVEYRHDYGAATAGVFLGKTDYPYTAANSGGAVIPEGYSISFAKSGVISVFLATGVTRTQIGTVTGGAIANNATAHYRVRVTPTQITVDRIDVAATLTVTDATHRPLPYLQFQVYQARCAFHSVSVLPYTP
jgi:glycerophosphoryl diester phosphodiesterase